MLPISNILKKNQKDKEINVRRATSASHFALSDHTDRIQRRQMKQEQPNIFGC